MSSVSGTLSVGILEFKFRFSESLERDLSNDIINVHIWDYWD